MYPCTVRPDRGWGWGWTPWLISTRDSSERHKSNDTASPVTPNRKDNYLATCVPFPHDASLRTVNTVKRPAKP